ncbi:MAG: hypothetical protein AAGB31_11765 [Bdellovibrio sp.]
MDLKSNVCAEYKIVRFNPIEVVPVAEWDLEKCHGITGFDLMGISEVLDYVEEKEAQ